MLRLAEGSASMVSRVTLVPVPIFSALKISEPPIVATAWTEPSVVTSLLSWALTVATWFSGR